MILEFSIYPGVINSLVNIIITLERDFKLDIDKAIVIGKKLQKYYGRDIDKYMRKWFNYGKSNQRIKIMEKKSAFKEQLARGFIKIEDFNLDPNLPIIRSNIKPYVYPKQWPLKKGINLGGIYIKLDKVGVSGWSGIKMPKKLLNK